MKMNITETVPPAVPPREIHVKPTTYQPSKAELEEPIRVDATPEELARAIMQPTTVITDR